MGKVFEIFIQDLTDECRKQLEDTIGTDHNFDVFSLAEVYYGYDEEEEEN